MRGIEMKRELIDEIEKEMLALDERAYNYKLLSKCKQALELPKGEYVPMTRDEWEIAMKDYDLSDQVIPWRKYIEAEAVRRMKEQGLV